MFSSRSLVLFAISSSALLAQVSPEQFAAIKKEGLGQSQVMAHLDHLVNRIGPRLTGSDHLTVAGEWAVDAFQSFGIENARLEKWGDYAVGFNRGPWWGRMTKPIEMEFVCNTNAWTAGTRGPSRGMVVAAPEDAEELAAMAAAAVKQADKAAAAKEIERKLFVYQDAISEQELQQELE